MAAIITIHRITYLGWYVAFKSFWRNYLARKILYPNRDVIPSYGPKHFYHMTSDGGIRDFGRTMEAYFVSNIPRISAFPT